MKTRNLLFLSIALVFTISCGHQKIQDSGSAAPAESKPLPDACSNSVCKLKVEGYPQEVAVLIPPYADYKNVTIFFHGFSFGKDRDKNLSSIMEDFEIVKAFQESKSNRILIIPFSTGQNKDYQKFIKNKSDLRKFLNNAYKAFAMKETVEDVQIIAHSGAFLTTQNLIADKSADNQNLKISQITLLDATYSKFNARTFMRWLKSGDYKMTVIYLKNSPTEQKALELWSLFSGQPPGKVGGFNLGDGDYLTLIPEVEVRNEPDAHWLLVRKWFGRSL